MKIIKFVLLTWLFWMVISLWNFRFLLGVAFPPLIFLLPSFYLKYFDFLIVPIVVGIVGMGFAIRAVFERLTDDDAVFQSVVLINLGFLAPFVAAAEVQKRVLIAATLPSSAVECFSSRSFPSSVAIAGLPFQSDVHAVYVKGGEVFLWSYRNLAFSPAPKTTYRNVNWLGCSSAVSKL